MNVGDKLRAARERNGMTAKEVAKSIEISHTYIYDIEKGRKKPSLETIVDLAKLYNDETIIDVYFREYKTDSNIVHLYNKIVNAREKRNNLLHNMLDEIINDDPKNTLLILDFFNKLNKRKKETEGSKTSR